jgi:hypothetical protein
MLPSASPATLLTAYRLSGSGRELRPDHRAHGIEPRHPAAAGVDEPGDAGEPRRLEHVERAEDVVRGQIFERGLVGKAAEMHHAVRVRDRLTGGAAVTQIGDDRLLPLVLRCHRHDVDEAEPSDALGDRRAQAGPDPAGRAGEDPCLVD